MRILLSAFAFAPHAGSEPGVGWRWARELAREHEVTVLTDVSRAEKVEAELRAEPVPGLRVVYWRPRRLERVPLEARSAHLVYLAWQFTLLGPARALHAQQRFDLAIHLTYGVFRHPCFLGYLGIPFVFGPVGGGEDVPWTLKRSLGRREQFKELARSVANAVARFDPLLWFALRRAGLILVKTQDTRNALPSPWRSRAIVFPEIGVDCGPERSPPRRADGEALRLLFVGRLLGWKGIHLALRAVAAANAAGTPAHLTVVGSGPLRSSLHALARSLGLDDRALAWREHVPQPELFALYPRCHALLFPSLHDSSGNVVLEAQSFGLPVVCLDRGGPSTLVAERSARVVATAGRTETQVVAELAAALRALAADEPMRLAMGVAALAQARASSWRGRVDAALALAVARFSLPPQAAR